MLIKHCGFSRVPHDCFTLKTSNILCITFFEIILIVVKGTSLFVFQIRMDTITFPFYYECNFFLLNIHLFSDYFSSIFFFSHFTKGHSIPKLYQIFTFHHFIYKTTQSKPHSWQLCHSIDSCIHQNEVILTFENEKKKKKS